MDSISIQSFIRIQKERNPEDAKRCLFGPVNSLQNQKFIKEQNESHKKQMMSKYNFNFDTEEPIAGKYNWEKIGLNEQENIPEAYSMPQLTKSLISLGSSTVKKANSSNNETVMSDLTLLNSQDSSYLEDASTTLLNTSGSSQGCNGKKRRQSTITDYFPAKKRKTETAKRTD